MENSAPSLKIFRTKFSTSALYNGRNKNRRQNPVWEFTKTIIPFALVGYEGIITNSRYALVGYFITSYPTRANGIIVIYSPPTEWIMRKPNKNALIESSIKSIFNGFLLKMLLRSLPVYILKQLFFSISMNSGRIFKSQCTEISRKVRPRPKFN